MDSKLVRNVVIEALQDKKAEEIKMIDATGYDYHLADYIFLANGRSNKNVGAIGMAVADKLKEKGLDNIILEGFEKSEWVLVDTKSVIVNIFHPETRERFKLESLWDPKLIKNVSGK